MKEKNVQEMQERENVPETQATENKQSFKDLFWEIFRFLLVGLWLATHLSNLRGDLPVSILL